MNRQIEKYSKSDWLKVTLGKSNINYGIMFCNHYWYNPVHRIVLTIPMEEMFYLMIGKRGHKASNKFAENCLNVEPNGFTRIRRI
tara:strand:- start:330 stop:584 length:255 start_codon:yes stop_codon:yes gene_type:complete